MIRFFLLPFFTVLFALPFSASCQRAPEWTAAQIRLHLEKLNVLGSVLYVAAHPDDENSQLLAYFSNGKLYRTAYLSLNRGDGGQNLIGDEQGELLGLVRTQELLDARRVDGAEQFFSRANDFGFSKTATETMQFWGRDRILGDMVWVIREFRPDVIICRFPANASAGHGNHWASAILAHDAFSAAADPQQFPEQLRWVKPWQAKRLLWNTYNFGGLNTTSPGQFHINDGGFNPLIGESYGEIAGDSRSMHKTQGVGLIRRRGASNEFFQTILGDPPVDSILSGVNTGWTRVEGGEHVGNLVSAAIAGFDMDHPSACLPALLAIYKAIGQTGDPYWKEEKQKETLDLIQACAGLWLDAVSSEERVAPGDPVSLRIQVVNRCSFPLTLEKISYGGHDTTLGQSLADDIPLNLETSMDVSSDHPISQPYWLIQPHPIGYYEVSDQQMVGRPENPPAMEAHFFIRAGDQDIEFTKPVQYRFIDPVQGEQDEPLVITPPVTANLTNDVFIYSNPGPQTVQVNLEGFTDKASGTVSLRLPPGFRSAESALAFDLEKKGDKQTLSFQVSSDGPVKVSRTDTLTAEVHFRGKAYDRGIHVISYSHIPTITVFPPAQARMVRLNLVLAGKRIGYLSGAGDMVAQSLRQAGYDVTPLTDADIAHGDLSVYDAIVTGVRAYNVSNELKYLQDTLLSYVYHGGSLLVQYNKPYPMVTDRLGPYPFKVSNLRVTDETSAVDFLLPDDPAMNWPNKINQADFDGWIQERGLYFTEGADSPYRRLFAMHDPGESPLDGSTIITDYGKGSYVYTSLDFFRELPAGVPGAFRLFANLIAGPHHP